MINSPFLLKLKSIMLDNKYDRIVHNRKRGKLDDKSLYKVALNRNNIFKKKTERAGKEYNIVICVDQSGSMHCNRKIETASELSEFLVKTFEKIGNINVSLVGFNTVISEYKPIKKHLGREFMKSGSLSKKIQDDSSAEYNHKVEDNIVDYWGNYTYGNNGKGAYFVKIDKINKDRWGARPTHWNNLGAGNRDYDAIDFGYHILKDKKNPFLIVLSDGQPASNGYRGYNSIDMQKDDISYIRNFVKKHKNIKTWGVGILDNSVSKIYPDFAIVGSISTLCPVVLEYFKKNIKRG